MYRAIKYIVAYSQIRYNIAQKYEITVYKIKAFRTKKNNKLKYSFKNNM